MNKRKFLFLLLIIALVIFIGGCATTVSMRYLVPAEIDMSSYKNLAVLSVEPYRFNIFSSPSSIIKDMSGTSPYRIESGLRQDSEREVAKYLSSRIVSDLTRADYFKLLVPPSSDAVGTNVAQFKQRGYDALLLVQVKMMGIDEYIFAKEEIVKVPPKDGIGNAVEEKVLNHYVMQKTLFTVEFTLKDTNDGRIITVQSFTKDREYSYKIIPGSTQSKVAPDLYRWFVDMSNTYSRDFVNMIVPRWVTQNVALMDNKPEVPSLKRAYEAAKAGNIGLALEAFQAEWARSKHLPSGYNAAIILDSFGRVEEALALIEEVWRFTGNRTVQNRMFAMREAWEKHQQAQQQL